MEFVCSLPSKLSFLRTFMTVSRCGSSCMELCPFSLILATFLSLIFIAQLLTSQKQNGKPRKNKIKKIELHELLYTNCENPELLDSPQVLTQDRHLVSSFVAYSRKTNRKCPSYSTSLYLYRMGEQQVIFKAKKDSHAACLYNEIVYHPKLILLILVEW